MLIRLETRLNEIFAAIQDDTGSAVLWFFGSNLGGAYATLGASKYIDRRAGAGGPRNAARRNAGAGDTITDVRRREHAWSAGAATAERNTLLQRRAAGQRRAGAGQCIDHQPGRAASDGAAGRPDSAATGTGGRAAAHAHNRAGGQRGTGIYGGRRARTVPVSRHARQRAGSAGAVSHGRTTACAGADLRGA